MCEFRLFCCEFFYPVENTTKFSIFLISANLYIISIRCNQIMLKVPDQVDGLNRLAMVYEARGENSKAADYYRKAADFAKLNPGFDKQMVKWFLSEARRMNKAT